MARLEGIISDFGGVLTSPLLGSFVAYQESSGVPLEELGKAMAAVGEKHGANPLFELETGRLTEAEFINSVGAQLSQQLSRQIDMNGFAEGWFANLNPNQELIDYMRDLRGRGLRMAICTNNVREWESRWRAMVPVDEIFDVVVDSAFVGTRKPERRIYELTLEQLGTDAGATLMLDDVEINCAAARELGMQAVHFQSNEQAIEEIETALRQAD
ncbi:MAG TPA: HAD family phosphatase [Solirubrobacteraceae bacterium]|jgi:epoxide hydrolase-like predicted phosphatase